MTGPRSRLTSRSSDRGTPVIPSGVTCCASQRSRRTPRPRRERAACARLDIMVNNAGSRRDGLYGHVKKTLQPVVRTEGQGSYEEVTCVTFKPCLGEFGDHATALCQEATTTGSRHCA
jgi:hypothetical protein